MRNSITSLNFQRFSDTEKRAHVRAPLRHRSWYSSVITYEDIFVNNILYCKVGTVKMSTPLHSMFHMTTTG